MKALKMYIEVSHRDADGKRKVSLQRPLGCVKTTEINTSCNLRQEKTPLSLNPDFPFTSQGSYFELDFPSPSDFQNE